MCGRYAADEAALEAARDLADRVLDLDGKTGDRMPASSAPVLSRQGRQTVLGPMTWGFAGRQDHLIINARLETAAYKPAFAAALEKGRCALPASWFYEWDAASACWRFAAAGGQPFFLAGLWRFEGTAPRFVVLTTAADACMAPVHGRMPLALSGPSVRAWLTGTGSQVPPTVPLEKYPLDGQLRLF